jgi:murein DD-endopeptidase MepM/ murein hydrolase activator NlpD
VRTNRILWLGLATLVLLHYGWLLFQKTRDLALYHENRRLRQEVQRIDDLVRDVKAMQQLNSGLRRHLGVNAAPGSTPAPDSLAVRMKALAGATPPLQGGIPRGSPVDGVPSRGFHKRSLPGDLDHPGFDLAAPGGAPVYATASGRVLFAGHTANWGWLIVLHHVGDWHTWYGHLQPPLVRLGEEVRRGSVLGTVAPSSRKAGAHLHYAIQRQAVFVDPAPFLATEPLSAVH